jgi:alkylation response protein AidB-like acyl-CoA dehydrogenase
MLDGAPPTPRGRNRLASISGLSIRALANPAGGIVTTQAERDFDPDTFRVTARSWLAENVPQVWRENRSELSEAEIIATRRAWGRTVFEAGYAGLSYPVEYGGQALPSIATAIFYEEAARSHAPEELNRLGRNLAGPAILTHGTDAQKETYIPRIINEDEIWCEGFSEPNAGSDLAAVTTFGERDGDVFRINGSKIWTSLAHLADRCYLLAKTDMEAPRHHNLTVFLLDMHQPGVEIVPLQQITGESMFNQVFFTDAVARSEDVLGEVNGGWALGTISEKGFRASGPSLGFWHHYIEIQELIDQLEECTTTAGASLDNVQDFRNRLELIRWHVLRTSGVLPDATGWFPAGGISAEIKIAWSELVQQITAVGLEMSCSKHKKYWRAAFLEFQPATLYGGSVEIQRNVIADQVLRLRKA